jgi:hypothetical protein
VLNLAALTPGPTPALATPVPDLASAQEAHP